jgi:hypothetical protein
MKKLALILSSIIFATSAVAQANLISNGSFETVNCADRVAGVGTACTNNLSAGQWVVLKNVTGGWTTVSGSGIEIRDAVSGIAQNGSNFVELDAHGKPGSDNSFMQQVFNSPTSQMMLSFWYAARPGTSPTTNGINVFFNGTNVTSSLVGGPNVGNGSSNTSWIQYTLALNGNAGSNTLGFKAIGKDDTYGGSLDNIYVTAVPEPGTLALLLAGLGCVGFVAHRRRTGN